MTLNNKNYHALSLKMSGVFVFESFFWFVPVISDIQGELNLNKGDFWC